MAPGQSTQSAYHLGPSVSLDHGAPPFALGECVLVRIPEPIQEERRVENEATIFGTNLSSVSVGSGPRHLSFVRDLRLLPDGSFVVEVYPVLSFSNNDGALVAYNTMNDVALLPLPPLSFRHPTPDAFGQPLDFGNWSTARDSFLHVFPRQFTMTTKGSFKRMEPPLFMPFSVLTRINNYREYLLLTTNTPDNSDQSHPLPNGGSGGEKGNSNTPHGQLTGYGEGQAAFGITSVTTSPITIGDGSEGAAAAGLEKISFKSTGGLLILEDVDEDAEDVDATMRDELVMLARDNPMWMGELTKYMQKEEKEKERIQNEHLERLAQWREDTAVQLTC